jgi:pyruvate kinase
MAYKIVATLGPGSETASTWKAMLAAGVTAFRLNTSHLSLAQLQGWLERLTAFLAAVEPPPPLILDLQGSKWRLGHFPAFELISGEKIKLVYAVSADRPGLLPVPHADFFQAAAMSSGEVVLNDARVRLVMESMGPDWLIARVVQGGEIISRKGLTFTSSEYRQESLNDQDQVVLEQTQHLDFIRYALSYVKDGVEMAGYRAHFGRPAYLIAKLERGPALAQAGQMVGATDELWLCRGDLGAELGAKAMAEAVYRFSELVRTLPVPVLLAGQVLEHMSEHPTPTRSEVCYLHDALKKGYQGVVLSDETAVGRYPVESCRAAALFRT